MTADRDERIAYGRPFGDLRDSGLLWLFNAAALHPRGQALALHYPTAAGEREPTGWSLIPAGNHEPWTVDDGLATLRYRAVERTIRAARRAQSITTRDGRVILARDVEDGGVRGDLVVCDTCSGSGELHAPYQQPPVVTPEDSP